MAKWDSKEIKMVVRWAVRKVFRRSTEFRLALDRAKREFPAQMVNNKRKSGVISRYECAHCKNYFAKVDVEVDHIVPACPLDKAADDMNYDDTIKGIFCDASNLQVLCAKNMADNNGLPSCHRKKCNIEAYMRAKIKEMREEGTFTVLDSSLLGELERNYEQYVIERDTKAALKAAKSLERKRKQEVKK